MKSTSNIKMNDKSENLNEISEEALEIVSGGTKPGEEYIQAEDEECCGGNPENGRHEWVKTGNHKEESFFVFWTKGFDEYRCTKCGATKWVHV